MGPGADGWADETDVGWFGAFHPSVTQLRVTTPDGTVQQVETVPMPDAPDGPRFAAFTTPPGVRAGTEVALLRTDGSTVLEWTPRN